MALHETAANKIFNWNIEYDSYLVINGQTLEGRGASKLKAQRNGPYYLNMILYYVTPKHCII